MSEDIERCDNAWCPCHVESKARCAMGSAKRSVATETERTAKEIPYFVPNLTELRILLAVTLVLGGVIVYILVSEGLHYAVGP